MRGAGFQFALPTGWTVQRSPAQLTARRAAGPRALVSTQTFALQKPYRPALFAQAAKELDGVAAKLAAQASGRVTERVTTTVAGVAIRAYRFVARPASAPAYEARIGFVLRGRREVQLYCQAPVGAGDPDGACRLLFESFSLSK